MRISKSDDRPERSRARSDWEQRRGLAVDRFAVVVIGVSWRCTAVVRASIRA